MKKITPYIFIVLIFANFLAPFSVGIDKNNNPTITKSEVEAGDIQLTLKGKSTKTTIDLLFSVARFKETRNHGMVYMVTDKYGTTVIPKDKSSIPEVSNESYLVKLVTRSYDKEKVSGLLFQPPDGAKVIKEGYFQIGGSDIQDTGVIKLIDLPVNTTYYISYAGFNGDANDAYIIETDSSVKTKSADEADDEQFYEVSSASGGGFLPACVWGLIKVSPSGCIAQLLYVGLFQPTAYLFSLAGKFFDFTFFYSISDDSYRSPFVIEGWGLVRDFVNIFFIFVLLWIAFSTILNVHGFKTKEMVINVVIIGLLINFSLFAAQILIDTSNILARVFYNSITSPQKDKSISEKGIRGEVKISEQIVGFANPQKIIAKANRVGVIAKQGDQASNTGSNSYGLSNGTFILVTLLSSAVNIVGLFVFISVGLIFVARVIGLWLAMILVPLAFFSYTVPAMQTIDMIGWKKWWPDTLKMAFLAPIFIFFMYLIIKFLGIDNFFASAQEGEGPDFLISVLFPFAFIMILMMKAKGVASKLAGDIGTNVTKGAVALGGAALGGAALTGAALGRNTLGSVSKYIHNDSARKKDMNTFGGYKDWNLGKKLNPFAYIKQAGKTVAATVAQGVHSTPSFTGLNPDGTVRTLGDSMKSQDKKVTDKAHAEHALDEAAVAITGNKDAKYKDLDEPEAKAVKEKVDRDIISKADFGKTYDRLNAGDKATIDAKKGNFDYTTGAFTADPNGTFSYHAQEVANAAHANGQHIQTAGNMAEAIKANTAMGEFVRSLRKGSYDIRELSKIKKSGSLTAWGIGGAALLGGVFLPIGIALAASTSGAIKKGLKSATGGVDHGSAQKDFLKDLSHTINSALSHMKIDVKVGGGGDDSHAKASAGGGHH